MSRRCILPLAFGAVILCSALAPASSTTHPATTQPAFSPHTISPLQAIALGIVEGVTEYLPVSSTGHLILASHAMGLTYPSAKEAVDAFTVVIQIGAVLAVLGLYRRHVGQMLRGLAGRDPAGLRLLGLLFVAFLPAAVFGLIFNRQIKAHLFAPGPVVGALAVGGVLMIAVEAWRKRTPYRRIATIDTMTVRMALLIGLAQCLAMWPGTSRSMITILAAILVGLEIKSAAEFSFLLALPTLGGAALHDAVAHRAALAYAAGPASIILGLLVSAIVAAIAVRSFVAYLSRRGLAPFGYYRIALAAALLAAVLSGWMSF